MGDTIIKQYFNLYNTAGLVDKDRNIYFVPHKDKLYSKYLYPNKTKVCDCYYDLFNEVSPFSSAYQDTEISQWSPEDRTLVVEGLIDTFRKMGGLALNYLVVKREIYTKLIPSGVLALSSRYYIAFFIDSVEQAGSRSVKLNLTPDHFTNFFYFNNEQGLTSNYDPFNSYMKNCFVERQHYDRVERLAGTTIAKTPTDFSTTEYENIVNKLIVGEYYQLTESTALGYTTSSSVLEYLSFDKITIEYRDETTNELVNTIKTRALKIGGSQGQEGAYNIKYEPALQEPFIALPFPTGQYVLIKIDTKVSLQYYSSIQTISNTIQGHLPYKVDIITKLKPINNDKILSSSESFKYKYQYKDMKCDFPIYDTRGFSGYNELKTDELKSIYESLKSCSSYSDFYSIISSLSEKNKRFIVSIFISYLVIQYKENILLPLWIEDYLAGGVGNIKSRGGLQLLDIGSSRKLEYPIIEVTYPFLYIPDELKNIQPSWLHLYYSLYNIEVEINNSSRFPLKHLQECGASQYILSAFVTRYSPCFALSDNMINISLDSHNGIKITFKGEEFGGNDYDASFISEGYLRPCFLPPKALPIDKWTTDYRPSGAEATIWEHPASSHLNSISLQGNGGETYVSNYTLDLSLMGFMSPKPSLNSTIELKISSDVPYLRQLNKKYYDPLLESEPYSFYTVSFLETEQIINKSRYFTSYENDYYKMKYTFINSQSEGYKLGLIPAYIINGKEYRYYNEALTFVYSSSLPIIEDSWLTYYALNKAQMKSQYAIQENNYRWKQDEIINKGAHEAWAKAVENVNRPVKAVGSATATGIRTMSELEVLTMENECQVENIRLSQQAKMADMGAKPNTVRLAGSDMLYDLSARDYSIYLNHYHIDEMSYNSIAKSLERFGYVVNIYDNLNCFDRVGLNYIKLVSFDFVEDTIKLPQDEMSAVTGIFSAGVTLLHDKDYLHNIGESGYHNIESSLGGD